MATVPGFPAWAGAGAANGLCFVGSWFFTTAAWMQLISTRQQGPHSRASDAESASAAVQFAGTLLFNLSTGAAVWAHAVSAQRRYVWAPDATPSAVVAALTPPLGAAGRRLVLWRDGERIDVSRLALWMRLARDVGLPWVAKYAPAAVPPVVEPTWQLGDLYRVEDDANDIARVETALALVWPSFSMSATEPATTPDSPWIV